MTKAGTSWPLGYDFILGIVRPAQRIYESAYSLVSLRKYMHAKRTCARGKSYGCTRQDGNIKITYPRRIPSRVES